MSVPAAKEHYLGQPTQKHLLAISRQARDMLNHLAEDLLVISHLDPEETDRRLLDVHEKHSALLVHFAEEHDLVWLMCFVLELTKAFWTIWGDPGKLR